MKKMDTKMLRISEVRVAERIRKDNGGLEELAGDIREHGLINPITVMEQSEGGYVLIAGLRRLKAMERMGAKEIRATVMTALEADEMLMLEIAENEQRKEFTVSEKLAFAEKLKAVEAEKARVRKSAGGKGGLDQDVGNCPHLQEQGRSRDIVAQKAGFSSDRQMRRAQAVQNALQIGDDAEGGYLVPDEYERTLVDALQEENRLRGLCKIIRTSSGDRKIPLVASHGTASWVEEEGTIPESDDAFGQITIGAHKIASMIKVSDELLQDSVFDVASYIATEFARRVGDAEEAAFINGDGSGKPYGMLHATNGAAAGVTAASATAITADELLDLIYSLRAPYRKRAVFLMHDSTIKAIRKLKDGNGQYLWQPGMKEGAPDMLLGYRLVTSTHMPVIAAAAKPILFGDLTSYWIADREGRSMQRLNELYAATGQVGFRVTQRVDGRLVQTEGLKCLAMKSA